MLKEVKSISFQISNAEREIATKKAKKKMSTSKPGTKECKTNQEIDNKKTISHPGHLEKIKID
jgi:hypothetical protein